MNRRFAQTGFTLLEILVVVTLIAGIAAFVMPALLGGNPGKEQRAQADRVSRLLTLASDYSLFRGQLVAITLAPDSVTPLVFNLEEQDFIEVDEQGLRALTLEEPVQLEWELDMAQVADEPTLAQAALSVRDDKKNSTATKQQPDATGKEDPQIFFFPSGEATSATLLIRHPDNPENVRLKLDAMGRITDPDAPVSDEEDDERP